MLSVISVSRDTVLPCELGAPPLSKVEICVSAGTPPLSRAVDRADSNETPFERNEGVFTLAMLFARASPRWASPLRAYCVACIVTSAIPSNRCLLMQKNEGREPGLLPSSIVIRGSIVLNRVSWFEVGARPVYLTGPAKYLTGCQSKVRSISV